MTRWESSATCPCGAVGACHSDAWDSTSSSWVSVGASSWLEGGVSHSWTFAHERERLELPTFLSALTASCRTSSYLKTREHKNTQQLKTITLALANKGKSSEKLVLFAGLSCLSQKSSLWVITRHKIILVGESAPQNRPCGVLVPPQTRSCSEEGKKHEHEREGKMQI